MKKEEKQKCFMMQGSIGYELELWPDEFTVRSQVSNENNLAILAANKQLMETIVLNDNQADKKNKIPKKEIELIKKSLIISDMLSTRLAGHLYQQQLNKEKNEGK